jgi:hypothetical protein
MHWRRIITGIPLLLCLFLTLLFEFLFLLNCPLEVWENPTRCRKVPPRML